ncbi:MAG: response regulator transcription factor [Candidatus Omnitrophica bacterium]|nr:response regulator transcription factor [Candidatus Omnitrophota bacterium]
MPKSKIILADDHSFVRVGLKELINRDPDLTVVAEAKNGQELLDILDHKKCDVIVMDISMPGLDGIATIKELDLKFKGIKVLILSMLKDYPHFKEVMAHGAAGYMVKDDAADLLVSAIKTILRGKKYISPSVTTMLADRELRSLDEAVPSLEILTKREKQILAMIAKSMPNKNIAAKLKISIRTVEHHRANLTDKLGFKDSASLVKYAMAKGLA